jgi:hypothetical protein
MILGTHRSRAVCNKDCQTDREHRHGEACEVPTAVNVVVRAPEWLIDRGVDRRCQCEAAATLQPVWMTKSASTSSWLVLPLNWK